jgi:hypothetical protein
MSYSIELERAFLAKEFSRNNPTELRIMGTLLDSAFRQAPANQEIEMLTAELFWSRQEGRS